jgi:hypothetical protein
VTIHTLQEQRCNDAEQETATLRNAYSIMEQDLDKSASSLADDEKAIRGLCTKHQRLALSIDLSRSMGSTCNVWEARAEAMKAQMTTTDVMTLKKLEAAIYLLRGKQKVLEQCAEGVLVESIKERPESWFS